TCDVPVNLTRYCNPEFDKLFAAQSRTFDVQKRAEITHQMERILLRDIPDDRGFYWKSAMAYWNRVKQWPPLQGTTVYNFGKFERVWCQDGRCMRAMPSYIIRRISLMIPTLLGAVTLIFLLMRLLPGDVALYILGSGESSDVNKEALEQIRQDLGLDQPLIVQYGRWLWGAARLDFGNSYWTRQPVIEELQRRYPMTANLAVMSLLLGTLIAIPIGVLSAIRQDTLIDYAARIFVIAGLSIPNFWLAILVILGLVP